MIGCKWFVTSKNHSFLSVLPSGGQYWGIRWNAIAWLWECVCYSWKCFAMEDNSKTSKFSTGQQCFSLLKVCAILLLCMVYTKHIHFLSLSLASLYLSVYCNEPPHHDCNFLMWAWKDNCHRNQSSIHGISLERAFPHLFCSPCFPHWGTSLVRNHTEGFY